MAASECITGTAWKLCAPWASRQLERPQQQLASGPWASLPVSEVPLLLSEERSSTEASPKISWRPGIVSFQKNRALDIARLHLSSILS